MPQSEQEVVDPVPKLREECRKGCPKQLELYKACVRRIQASGVGDCEAWYIDLVSCVDHCVAPKIFKLTKEG
jgi:ubiquinol-cytochrome c reductase subunit 6